MRRITTGTFDSVIEAEGQDEISKVLLALQSMQTKLGFEVAETKRVADENLRIKIALDNVATNVMIADRDCNIIYMNKSIADMMTVAEADLRKVLPAFNAAKLMGSNIDQFHKNPAHQRNMLATFNSNFKTQINIGSRTFALAANPVINEQGERLGSVVEWNDRTAEVKVENEIASIVAAASNGDFTQRIALEGKEGFFRSSARASTRLSILPSRV